MPLRQTRRLLMATGLVGCGAAAAAVLLNGLTGDGLKARAANVIPHQFRQHLVNEPPISGIEWDYNWDKRESIEPIGFDQSIKRSFRVSEDDPNNGNEKVDKPVVRATRHLFLIRHGQYNEAGESDLFRTLTALGEEQANYVGLRLKQLAHPYTRIVRSTMTRATQTANIISKHLPNVPVDSCDLLREGSPIVPEPPSLHWRPEYRYVDDGARIEAAFRKYFHRADAAQKEDSYEVIVCHANVIRYFICRALQFPPEAWLRFTLYNCSTTWFAIPPSGRLYVYTIGDTGHVPTHKMSKS